MTTPSIQTWRQRVFATALAVMLAAATLAPLPRAEAGLDPLVEAQQLVYETNLARWNPPAFAARAGDVEFPVGFVAAPPLALNSSLVGSAMFKANELTDYDYWSHQSAVTGLWPNQLARNFGYPLPTWWSGTANYIESLHAGSPDPFRVLASFARSPGHRVHVFGQGGWGRYDEIGAGRSTNENYWAIHTAYQEPDRVFVTGVVFEDANGNGRMDLGEGAGGTTVQVGGTQTTTNAGGGYSVRVSSGTFAVSAPGYAGGVVQVGQHNVGVDFVLGAAAPIIRSYELCNGLAPTMLGTSGDDTLYATAGADIIHGLDGYDVVIGAGPDDVLCSAIAWTADGDATQRIAGRDRFATAAAISQTTHPDGAETVYIAVGTNYPDAIAAGSAAAVEDAPILLVKTDEIPIVTLDELERLDPNQVVILGGTAAVGADVETHLAIMLDDASVVRRHGATRYETATEVSRAAFPTGSDTVYVTGGVDFATAIAAAPAAIATESPLLLVPPAELPDAVTAELVRLGPTEIVVVGGPHLVAPEVLEALRAFSPVVTRITATNGYSAAVAVSTRTFAPGLETVYVAVGDRFPDALAGGPATRLSPGPILLVTPYDVPNQVRTELTRLAPSKIVILGGPAAVSESIESLLAGFVSGE